MSAADLTVWLVHHGDALGADVDPMRPLSAHGLAAVERLALAVAERGPAPRAVWHSGKLRARQTAEACWRACGATASFSAVPGVQPSDAPDRMRDEFAGETGVLMIVGHLPHLPRLLRLLVSGDPDRGPEFPPHGAVCLERREGLWLERWRSG